MCILSHDILQKALIECRNGIAAYNLGISRKLVKFLSREGEITRGNEALCRTTAIHSRSFHSKGLSLPDPTALCQWE